MRLLLCLFISSSLFSSAIELFIDWRPFAKGEELFPLEEEHPSLLGLIRKSLLAKGLEIRSWEPSVYRPWLLSWRGIKEWKELQFHLGWNTPRINPFKKETRYWIFWGLGPQLKNFEFHRLNPKNLILFLWEPPVVQPEGYHPKVQKQFGKIFTWNDELVDGRRFFKFYYPVLTPKIKDTPLFQEKKFCTLIASRLSSKHPKSLYQEREKMIRFFEDKIGEFDLYGRNWEKRNFKNYKGTIQDKLSVLKNYKFCICYENTKDMQGYITEKIFDCFAAGSVPIYWGASNVSDSIPPACFIDRRSFKEDQELYDFLKGISQEQYADYITAAENFLTSEQAQLFSVENFIETFLSSIEDK